MRAEPLAYEAAELVPGLTPTRQQVAAESARTQSAKDGIEIDQGIFFANVLMQPDCGTHFCHAMLLPTRRDRWRGSRADRQGHDRLGTAAIERRGKASYVTLRTRASSTPRTTRPCSSIETAVDLALLDPAIEIGVLRGDTVDNPKYAGRRLFCTGINLTHLYRGMITVLWYVTREMGFVNKFLRGLADADAQPGRDRRRHARETVGRRRRRRSRSAAAASTC